MSRLWLVRATAAVVILGAGAALSAWGTADARPADMAPMASDEPCLPPENVQHAIERGAAVHVASCAGCHDAERAGVGPSYAAIVARHRSGSEGRSLAALAKATTHPRGGFTTFAPPTTPPILGDDDQNALAYWMWRSERR